MQDKPDPDEILRLVADFLREDVIPTVQGRIAFHARVAAHALDLVARQHKLAPIASSKEFDRLQKLFAAPDATLESLNSQLNESLRSSQITLETPGVRNHLWRTTLEKLAVDQPNYPSYQRTIEKLQSREDAEDEL